VRCAGLSPIDRRSQTIVRRGSVKLGWRPHAGRTSVLGGSSLRTWGRLWKSSTMSWSSPGGRSVVGLAHQGHGNPATLVLSFSSLASSSAMAVWRALGGRNPGSDWPRYRKRGSSVGSAPGRRLTPAANTTKSDSNTARSAESAGVPNGWATRGLPEEERLRLRDSPERTCAPLKDGQLDAMLFPSVWTLSHPPYSRCGAACPSSSDKTVRLGVIQCGGSPEPSALSA